jgi:DNA-binding Lrp family transcriptional regulator
MSKNVKAFVPSVGPLILSLIALAGLLFGLLFAFTSSSVSGAAPRAVLGDIGLIMGLFVLPPSALLLEIAGWWEKRIPAKALLASGALLLMLMAAFFLAVGGYGLGEEENFISSMGLAALCYAPLLLIFVPLPIYALLKTPEALRSLRFAEYQEQALDLIHARGGEVTYTELAERLELSETQVDRLLRYLVQQEKIVGYRAVKYGRFYTAPALVAKQERILSIIEARGQVDIDDLARELDLPAGLLREWLYDLVQQQRFAGYLNWEEGLVYSAEAAKLHPGGRCPRCGGELTLAGKGVVRCANCGTETFSEPPAPA